jgi:hypothetical protein
MMDQQDIEKTNQVRDEEVNVVTVHSKCFLFLMLTLFKLVG